MWFEICFLKELDNARSMLTKKEKEVVSGMQQVQTVHSHVQGSPIFLVRSVNFLFHNDCRNNWIWDFIYWDLFVSLLGYRFFHTNSNWNILWWFWDLARELREEGIERQTFLQGETQKFNSEWGWNEKEVIFENKFFKLETFASRKSANLASRSADWKSRLNETGRRSSRLNRWIYTNIPWHDDHVGWIVCFQSPRKLDFLFLIT